MLWFYKVYRSSFLQLFGPLGFTLSVNYLSAIISQFHTGFIYHYVLFLLFGLISYIGLFFYIEMTLIILTVFLFIFVMYIYIYLFVFIANKFLNKIISKKI